MNTVKEWSDAFDVLYNQVMSNAAAALDEYDKSIFLTKAQEEIVKNYFNSRGNKYQEGFDDNAKRQSDFATLIKSASLSAAPPSYTKFDARSSAFQFPADFFITINEQYQVVSGTVPNIKTYPYTIIPLSYVDYNRVMQKPYKYPPKSQVWRLITGEVTVHSTMDPIDNPIDNPIAKVPVDSSKVPIDSNKVPVVEIIGRYDPAGTGTYMLRYLKKPDPIILVDLTTIDNTLSINGVTAETTCALPAHIHEEILQRAVELAKAAYASDQNGTIQLNNQVQVGQRSE